MAACIGLLAFQASYARPEAPPPASKWEPAIRAFEAADRENPPPKNPILFIGSSSIRGWRTLANDFPEHTVINRGFGGSHILDAVHFADRVVLPYNPKLIVLYAGENDITAGKTPDEVFKDFKKFVRKVPGNTPIVFISLKPSPKRWHLREQFEEANRLIENHCRGNPRLRFVDVYRPMLDDNGEPRGELFVHDKLHLNGEGYALWTRILRRELERK